MKNKQSDSCFALDLQILDKVANSAIGYVDLLNSFPPAPEYHRMVSYLHRCGYLEGEEKAAGRIRITPDGQAFLLQLKSAAEEKAKKEKQQTFQNKVSVASVAIPAITFILGVVLEHYAGILRLLGL